MEIGEILKNIPGLTKEFLYYLESKNYIQPRHIRKQRLSRRDYSDNDLLLIRRAFELYAKGYNPRTAVEIAKKEPKPPSMVFSLTLSANQDLPELAFKHAGSTEDRYIKILPETHFLIVAEKLQETEKYNMRVSLHVDGEAGPFHIFFRAGSNIVWEVITDVNGNALVQGLTRQEIQKLKGNEVVISKEEGK